MLSLIEINKDSFIGHSLGLTRLCTKNFLTNCPINFFVLLSFPVDFLVADEEGETAEIELLTLKLSSKLKLALAVAMFICCF